MASAEDAGAGRAVEHRPRYLAIAATVLVAVVAAVAVLGGGESGDRADPTTTTAPPPRPPPAATASSARSGVQPDITVTGPVPEGLTGLSLLVGDAPGTRVGLGSSPEPVAWPLESTTARAVVGRRGTVLVDPSGVAALVTGGASRLLGRADRGVAPAADGWWTAADDGSSTLLRRFDADGAPVADRVLPGVVRLVGAGADGPVVTVAGAAGAFRSTDDGLRRVTDGTVLAVGSTAVLAHTCDDRLRCQLVLVAADAAAPLPLGIASADGPLGWGTVLVDPVRDRALVPLSGPNPTSILVDLRTTDVVEAPALRTPEGPIDDSARVPTGMVWGPDGWLLWMDDGVLRGIDADTGERYQLTVGAPGSLVAPH